VRAALQADLTGALQRRAYRFARTRAALVRQAGGRSDRSFMRELVCDAIADTWSGDLQWDPARCSLLDHLCGAMRRRTSDDAERVRRFQHLSIDGLFDGDSGPARHELESFLARDHSGTSAEDHAALVADVIDELRLLADPGDSAVAAILDAWADGMTTASDIIGRSRLSAPTYRAARSRIDRLTPELPNELRSAVLSLLRRAC
jgi:hypothetical protein